MLESLVKAANVTVSFKVWEIAVMVATLVALVYIAKLFVNGQLHIVEEE